MDLDEPGQSEAMDDHSLIVRFPLADCGFGSRRERKRFRRMASRIDRLLTERGLGTIDGDGFGDGTAELFIYGSDADAMLDGLEPLIRSFRPPPGATAVLLYGSTEDFKSRNVPLA